MCSFIKYGSNFKYFLTDYIAMFRGVGGGRCFVCGDFNLDLSGYENSSLIQSFVNSNCEHFLYSLINIPTRVSSYSATVIDHILCNFILESHLTSRVLLTDISVFILVCRMEVEKHRMMRLPVLTVLGIGMLLKIILSITIWPMWIFMRISLLTVP